MTSRWDHRSARVGQPTEDQKTPKKTKIFPQVSLPTTAIETVRESRQLHFAARLARHFAGTLLRPTTPQTLGLARDMETMALRVTEERGGC